MAQGRDTARHILGLGQAAIGISLASNFHDLLVAGNLPQRVGVGNASQDCIGGNPRRRQFHGQLTDVFIRLAASVEDRADTQGRVVYLFGI